MGFAKWSSSKRCLDYVVVFDTLRGLDMGAKRDGDETGEDQVTITHILERKRKSLVEAKFKLVTKVVCKFR
ncbi:hypothetical protein Hanom_Chr09g00861911 [Helianthus anomalus]